MVVVVMVVVVVIACRRDRGEEVECIKVKNECLSVWEEKMR